MVVAERVLGVYRIQERHQRIHVRLDAFAVGDAALHGVYRQSHQAEVPMAERRTRAYLAQPPVVEVFLGIPRAVGASAADDDLLVPLGESLLGLFERVPRLPPLLRQVYLLFRGKEVVQLFEREGVRVDRERPDRAAVLRLAADDAEPLVDALMLRVLPFPRRMLVPHPVGQAVLHVLQQALGVRV